MVQSKTIPGMNKGGLPKMSAFEKPGGTGRIPSNTATSPVKGSSNGKSGGTSFSTAKKSLERQSNGCC